MAIKEKTKINRARVLLLALCCIIYSISSKILGAHIGKTSENSTISTIRKRKNVSLGNKSIPSVAMNKQAQNNEIRIKVVEKVIAKYNLNKYKSTICTLLKLKTWSYSDFTETENMRYVSFYVCKCLLSLFIRYVNQTGTIYKEQYIAEKVAYDKAKKIMAEYKEDKNFNKLKYIKEGLWPYVSCYNAQCQLE